MVGTPANPSNIPSHPQTGGTSTSGGSNNSQDANDPNSPVLKPPAKYLTYPSDALRDQSGNLVYHSDGTYWYTNQAPPKFWGGGGQPLQENVDDAIEQTGSTDATTIINWLKSHNYSTSGFDAQHPPVGDFSPAVNDGDVKGADDGMDRFKNWAGNRNAANVDLEAPASISFASLHSSLQSVQNPVDHENNTSWMAMADGLQDQTVAFASKFHALEGWDGSTADAIKANVATFSNPTTGPVADLIHGMQALGWLENGFAQAMQASTDYINGAWPSYANDLRNWPNHHDEIVNDFDNYARSVFNVAYAPVISEIASNNPSFGDTTPISVDPNNPDGPPQSAGGPGEAGGAGMDPGLPNPNDGKQGDVTVTVGGGGGDGKGDGGTGDDGTGTGTGGDDGKNFNIGPLPDPTAGGMNTGMGTGGDDGKNFNIGPLPDPTAGGMNTGTGTGTADFTTGLPDTHTGSDAGVDNGQFNLSPTGQGSSEVPFDTNLPDPSEIPSGDPFGTGAGLGANGTTLATNGAGTGFPESAPSGLSSGLSSALGSATGAIRSPGASQSGVTDPAKGGGAASGIGSQAAQAGEPAAQAGEQALDQALKGNSGVPGGVPGSGIKGLNGVGGPGGGHVGVGGGGAGFGSGRGPAGMPVAAVTGKTPSLLAASGGGGPAAGGAGTPGAGSAGGGSPSGAGGQRGPAGKEHKSNKALRTKKNGEVVIGDIDAVVAVLGEEPNEERTDAQDSGPQPMGAHAGGRRSAQTPADRPFVPRATPRKTDEGR